MCRQKLNNFIVLNLTLVASILLLTPIPLFLMALVASACADLKDVLAQTKPSIETNFVAIPFRWTSVVNTSQRRSSTAKISSSPFSQVNACLVDSTLVAVHCSELLSQEMRSKLFKSRFIPWLKQLMQRYRSMRTCGLEESAFFIA